MIYTHKHTQTQTHLHTDAYTDTHRFTAICLSTELDMMMMVKNNKKPNNNTKLITRSGNLQLHLRDDSMYLLLGPSTVFIRSTDRHMIKRIMMILIIIIMLMIMAVMMMMMVTKKNKYELKI